MVETVAFLYFFSLIVIALLNYRGVKALRDYCTWYPNITAPALVCAILSTTIGAGTTLTVVGNIYSGGIYALLLMFLPIYWFNTSLFIRKLPDSLAECQSLPQLMGINYSHFAKKITAALSVVYGIGVITAQMTAIGLVGRYFFNISPDFSIIIVLSFITICVILGGIKSLVQSEVLQIFLFFIVLPVLIMFSNEIDYQSYKISLDIGFSEFDTKTVICQFIFVILPITDPTFIQKVLIAKDKIKIKKSLNFISLISVPFAISIISVGFYLRNNYPGLDAKEALLFFINMLPDALKALLVSGLLGIIMSCAASWLNCLSTIIANDIFKPKLWVARIAAIVVSLLSFTLHNYSSSILDTILLAYNFWQPLVMMPILAIFLGFKIRKKAFETSLLSGALGMVISVYFFKFGVVSLVIGTLSSVIGFSFIYMDSILSNIKSYIRSFNLDFVYKILGTLKPEQFNRIDYDSFAGFLTLFNFIFLVFLYDRSNIALFSTLSVASYIFAGLISIRDIIFKKSWQPKILPILTHIAIIFCVSVFSWVILFAAHDEFSTLAGLLLMLSLMLFVDIAKAFNYIIAGFFIWIFMERLFLKESFFLQLHDFSLAVAFFIPSLYLGWVVFKKQQRERKFYEMLSSAVAHELMTPLTAIKASSEVLEEMVSNRETLVKQDYNDAIKITSNLSSVSNKAISAVDGVLSSFRQVYKESSSNRISQYIKDSIQHFKLIIPYEGEIALNIEGDLKTNMPFKQFNIVMMNLLKNAVYHGGRNIRIEITVKDRKIHIKDYGKGIAPETLPYIFDPFYTTSASGNGIGLALCDRIIASYGGTMNCISELGYFTEFIISF